MDHGCSQSVSLTGARESKETFHIAEPTLQSERSLVHFRSPVVAMFWVLSAGAAVTELG